MRDAVIVDAVRTPIGRYGGALRDVRPDDLAAMVIQALVRRNILDPSALDDVIFGCANQAGGKTTGTWRGWRFSWQGSRSPCRARP